MLRSISTTLSRSTASRAAANTRSARPSVGFTRQAILDNFAGLEELEEERRAKRAGYATASDAELSDSDEEEEDTPSPIPRRVRQHTWSGAHHEVDELFYKSNQRLVD
ncbi:hypothetical protein PF005_g20517 [Phytophthora fragariae]|uniref:Uncharacterized protein n=1 Tax=Phytophthora fragariae TaxID=53985 RepID=A0A6A3SDM2_9STRA|nr:hypothetical protein PF011_g19186 [Phytophthora fragariae]KAE9088253.1 hypothetical protein PF010_g19437 [Phytophthora fragariae]KAE9107369.1 hypothetical protein PF007_g13062 [Phytophthora fragariae]KAE9113609.1 hypothetical protein PF006_g19703 [Phytophthora fragariae]KAE9187274.1 hypothetical protein PF005_g20517 [Phytophthora fragariae]